MKRVRLTQLHKKAMRRPRIEYFVEATYKTKAIGVNQEKDREIYQAARLAGARSRNQSGSGFYLPRNIRDIGFYFYRENTARRVHDIISRIEGVKSTIKKSVAGKQYVRC